MFQPGETSAELRMPILDKSLGVEGTEDFFVNLSIPASSVYLGVSAGSVDSVTVSILDDDNVTVEFSMTEYEVSESAGEVTLYISSDTPGAVNYTLLVYLSNGTATGECNTYTVCTCVVYEYTGTSPTADALPNLVSNSLSFPPFSLTSSWVHNVHAASLVCCLMIHAYISVTSYLTLCVLHAKHSDICLSTVHRHHHHQWLI